jgi:heat-inducible transcriptional repressor
MHLSERESRIIITIVEGYLADGKPVGSRTLSKTSGLNLSPASIRNIMADLTDKGLLSQPHTSAGRVPTAPALRFYLDTTAGTTALPEDDVRLMVTNLVEPGLSLTDLLREATTLLSALSKQVGMVLAPDKDDVRFRHIEFVNVHERTVLAVIVLEGGMIQNRILSLESRVEKDELTAFANYINHHFQGLTLCEVRDRVLRDLKVDEKRLHRLYGRALLLTGAALQCEVEREMYIDGAVNILDSPEFGDMDDLRGLLRVVEERSRLLEILEKTLETSGVKISIGAEAELGNISDCGIVSMPYMGKRGSIGVVGVIGPMRMNYSRVVPLVDFTGRMLSDMLKSRY